MLVGLNAVGRGIPGDTVAGVCYRITGTQDLEPSTCVLLVGTNDVLTNRAKRETEDSYRKMVKRGQEKWPMTQFLIVSVPPFSDWGTNAESKNQRVIETNAILAELAS